MNASLFYAAIAVAVLVLGIFSFIIGGKSTEARLRKENGDETGYHESIFDLVKLSAAGLVALCGMGFITGAMVLSAPEVLMVPHQWIGDPSNFLMNLATAIILTAVVGFLGGIWVYERAKGVKTTVKKTPVHSLALIAIVGIAVAFAIIAPVAAASCITEQMEPVTEIIGWAGNDMIPAVIVLMLAAVPLIMIMLGIKFAGGTLNSLLEGIRGLFEFKF